MHDQRAKLRNETRYLHSKALASMRSAMVAFNCLAVRCPHRVADQTAVVAHPWGYRGERLSQRASVPAPAMCRDVASSWRQSQRDFYWNRTFEAAARMR